MTLLAAIMRFIDQTLSVEGRVPTVNEIAARVGWSRYRLSRHVQDFTGMPLGEFARERQITLARQLLERTDLPMKEVGFRCGFARAPTFSRAFRKATGLTPTQYRLKVLAKVAPAQNGK